MLKGSFVYRCGLILLLFTLVAGCRGSQSTGGPQPTPTLAPGAPTNADAVLLQLVLTEGFRGSVLVAKDGKVLLERGYGLADDDKKTPITPSTRFRIYSLTMNITAIAITQLENQGKLSVKDPICNYLADCPEAWKPITLYHLLTHSSGIPDITDLGSIKTAPVAPAQLVDLFKALPLDFKPGDTASESTSGYILLGLVIEKVSGKSYEDYIHQAILDPLGMKDTGVDHNNNNVAPGYANDTQKAGFIDAGLFYAGGDLYSTTGDLYKLDQALYSDKLLPQTRLQEMFTPYVPYTLGLSYGYGWVVGPQLGSNLIGNTTARLGYSSAIERYPDQHLTVIVLSNLATNDIGIISHTLAQLFLPPG